MEGSEKGCRISGRYEKYGLAAGLCNYFVPAQKAEKEGKIEFFWTVVKGSYKVRRVFGVVSEDPLVI